MITCYALITDNKLRLETIRPDELVAYAEKIFRDEGIIPDVFEVQRAAVDWVRAPINHIKGKKHGIL